MNQPTTGQGSSDPLNQDLESLISGVAAGNADCENILFEILKNHVVVSIGCFLKTGSLEEDDILVETITVVFNYIKRDGGFDGDLIRFAITIARNRCRNILNQQSRRPQTPIEPLVDWIANEERSPLDNCLEDESRALLQKAIDSLTRVCRILLRSFYFEEMDIESIRGKLGLDTVQGVYYRRTVCLRELGNRLVGFSRE